MMIILGILLMIVGSYIFMAGEPDNYLLMIIGGLINFLGIGILVSAFWNRNNNGANRFLNTPVWNRIFFISTTKIMIVLGIILFIVFLPEIISGLIGLGGLTISVIAGIFTAIGNIFKAICNIFH